MTTFKENSIWAFGLADGGCQVGMVEKCEDGFLTVMRYHWLLGMFCDSRVAFPLSEVKFALEADDPHSENGTKVYPMVSLGDFQTRWNKKFKEAGDPA